MTVFDPQMNGTSDEEFRALLARTSDDGARDFTENQLYARYARGRVVVTRYISRRGKFGLVMIVVGLAIWVYALKIDWGLTLVTGIAITLGGVAQVGTGVVTRKDPAPRDPLARWTEKWLSVNAEPRLLQAPALPHAGLEYAPARVDALIVVERDLLVDLLLKNAAHTELNALIVSETAYPRALCAEAQRLLDERSDLKVIALHDATESGVRMHARLQASNSLTLGNRSITDIGLFAAEVGQLEELAATYPASHFTQVPVDALSYATLLAGLKGVLRGALTLSAGVYLEEDSPNVSAERAA